MNRIESLVTSYVDSHAARLTGLVQELVRIPSENKPPLGNEKPCQSYLAEQFRKLGLEPDLYEPDAVPGVTSHSLYWPGRNYHDRPNLAVRRPGSGGGRSLLLSGHIDTVPKGTLEWTRDPFGGEIEGNRLFGRGSNDMKGGVATNLFVFEAIAELGLSLRGDLLFETVVDEEFGGVNGTLAGRLRGHNADAAVLSEPSFLRICPAQRGGRTAHITFRAHGGILSQGSFPSGAIQPLRHFLMRLPDFAAERRRRAPVHELYRNHPDPVPVAVTKVFTGPWGTGEPVGPPESCRVEMYWQMMPGETKDEVEREFLSWMDSIVREAPELFGVRPEVEFPIRWMPGSAISMSEPLVAELAECVGTVTPQAPVITGMEGPCDMYIFHQVSCTPAVLWGARGGNTHAADEYLEIDSLVTATKALLLLVCRWCGAD